MRVETGADLEAAARLARSFDFAAGRGDDVLHDRQPEPRAAARARLVAAVEALEQARQVGGVDALAVVRDGEHRARRRDSSARPCTCCPGRRSGSRSRAGSRPRRGASAAAAAARRGRRPGPRARPRRGSARSPNEATTSSTIGFARVRPSETTSRPVSSSPRKSTSSISSRACSTSCRACSISSSTSAPGSVALSSSTSSRASGVLQLVRDGGGEALPQLLVGGQLRRRLEEEDEQVGMGGRLLLAEPTAGLEAAERASWLCDSRPRPAARCRARRRARCCCATTALARSSFTTPSPYVYPSPTRRTAPIMSQPCRRF